MTKSLNIRNVTNIFNDPWSKSYPCSIGLKMNNERKKRIQQRKAREKDQRRHEIIMTAKDLFISKGYDNTTMADIALKASLSKGTLYNYFQNKSI